VEWIPMITLANLLLAGLALVFGVKYARIVKIIGGVAGLIAEIAAAAEDDKISQDEISKIIAKYKYLMETIGMAK